VTKSLLCLIVCSLQGVAQTAHSVTLNWNWAQGTGSAADGFHVKRGAASGGPYATVGSTGASTLQFVDGAGPFVEGTTYYYVVTAYSATAGESDPSNEAPATIPLPAPPTAGLVGYWSFNEGSGVIAHDTSGNGYDGVTAAPWVAGYQGSALQFNGSTSSVITTPIPLGQTFTISAWVNPAGAEQGYSRIAEMSYLKSFYLGVDVTGGMYQFIVSDATGATGQCGQKQFGCAKGGAVTPGWHLVTATFDGSQGLLYVDHALVASETFAAPSAASLALYLGIYTGCGYGWNGGIDEVRLYNRALTAAEVAAL
jgi:hypothetical protein